MIQTQIILRTIIPSLRWDTTKQQIIQKKLQPQMNIIDKVKKYFLTSIFLL